MGFFVRLYSYSHGPRASKENIDLVDPSFPTSFAEMMAIPHRPITLAVDYLQIELNIPLRIALNMDENFVDIIGFFLILQRKIHFY